MKPRIERVGSLSFVAVVVFMLSASVFCSEVVAASYYISPNGSDSNNGTSGAPWKTFPFAIPRLQPGDSLILKDGTYTQSNSGFISISGKSGTATAPIAIKAENERRALLSGDGLTRTLFMNNCSYWVVEGLRLRGADNTAAGTGDVASLYNSHHITVRRLLVTHNNRYKNSHLFENTNLVDSLFEENELYYWHRHGWSDTSGQRNVYRRNYANSRGYANISGGYPSGSGANGDSFISLYPGKDTIVENNISEGNSAFSELNAAGYGGVLADDNQFLGNISLNEEYGIKPVARGNTDSLMPHNTLIKNHVSINTKYSGVYSRSAKTTRIENSSFIGGSSSQGSGVIADRDGSALGDGTYSISLVNTLATGYSAGYGVTISNSSGGTWTFAIDYASAYNAPFNPAASHPSITNEMTVNPNLGSCKLWIPDGSSLKQTGKNGADIGANILYRYQNGTLTSTPLWNSDGSFPHGVIITGVNDVAGASAFDVHQRLNVNTNGCSFPAGYGSSTVTSAPAPFGLRIVQ